MNKTQESPYLLEARKMGELIIEKQAAYGDSFSKSGIVMRLLYPNGIKLEQMDDALTMVRTLDKLFRIATKKNAFGENPWKDIMGYALLSVVKERHDLNSRDFAKEASILLGVNVEEFLMKDKNTGVQISSGKVPAVKKK